MRFRSTATATPVAQVSTASFTQNNCYCYPNNNVNVTITTTTPNAQIRWTNDGSEPIASNPNAHVINGSSGNATGNHQDTFTFRAVAFKAGWNDSDEGSDTFYYDGESQGMAEMQGQGSAGPAYDANGNLTGYKDWTYTYDAQNRLTSATNGATSAEFYYDGKNRQIARRIGGVVRFSAWDNWELLEEYGSGLSVAKGYLQGATGVIKSWDPIYGQMYYYQDELGSTTHVANASGALVENFHYDLYGTPAETSTHGIVDFYAGERWIPELGLYDLRNRFMSPQLGRFLQPDPIGFKGDASNLYRYCHNDPVDRSDSTGLTDLNYVGGDNYKDWNLRYALDNYFNPKDVISVGAHAGPTSMTNTTVRPHAPLTATQVVRDIASLDKAKNNTKMPIRLYMCRAGDWREAAKEGKLCPAQDIADQSRRKVEATGAWINPRNETKWSTDTCPDTNWYEFSPNAAEPKRIDDPTGFRKGGVSSNNLGNGESKRDTRPVYDAFGSTTLEAARWENSYGYGGWFQIEKNLGR